MRWTGSVFAATAAADDNGGNGGPSPAEVCKSGSIYSHTVHITALEVPPASQLPLVAEHEVAPPCCTELPTTPTAVKIDSSGVVPTATHG